MNTYSSRIKSDTLVSLRESDALVSLVTVTVS